MAGPKKPLPSSVTPKRMYDRLVVEYGFTGGEPMVRRFVVVEESRDTFFG